MTIKVNFVSFLSDNFVQTKKTFDVISLSKKHRVNIDEWHDAI